MNERKIILIQEILASRDLKRKELAFYLEKKEELERKLNYIRHELRLTDLILELIEKEKIEEIKK